MPRAEPLEAAVGSGLPAQPVVRDIVEGFQQDDRDDRDGDEEGKSTGVEQGKNDQEADLNGEVGNHPVISSGRFERPGLAELTDNRTDQESVKSFASSGGGGIFKGRRSAMVAVQVS